MKPERFSILKTIKSFGFAFNGLKILIKEEPNARIHVLAIIGVLFASFFLRISTMEWISILLAIGLVMALEIVNSAIENMADFISPERHAMIKRIKDLSAAAVLISAMTAFIIGLMVFLPKILKLF